MIKKPDLAPTKAETFIEIDNFYTAFAYLYSPSFSVRPEVHDCWELVFVNNGEVTAVVEDEEHILKKNQLILHAPNMVHWIRANDVTCSVGIVTFSLTKGNDILHPIKDTVINIGDMEKTYILNAISEGTLLMSGKNHVEIVDPDKLANAPIMLSQAMKNSMELLLISLLRRQHSGETASLEKLTFNKNNIVNSVVEFITLNLDKRITLETISKHTGYSVSYISSVFKKQLNTSLIAFVLNARITRAKELIAEGRLSFREIAEKLSFDSVQYFSTQFKKLTHQTPSQYQSICKFSNNKYKFGDITKYV